MPNKFTEDFNCKIAELLKNSTPEEITQILQDDKSLIVPMHNNNNQNGGAA